MAAPVSTDLLKDSAVRRRTMVECQIRTFDVTDQRVIGRFFDVPRELFVPDNVRDIAYSDVGVVVPVTAPDLEPRYLLPPLVLARLLQGARIRATDRILDIACGTGYSTAILSGLAASVLALESDETLCGEARSRLETLGNAQISVRQGPLDEGAPSDAPFDVILVNGVVQTNLDKLFAQLGEGGRLVTIRRGVDDPTGRASKAMCYEKRGATASGRFLFDATAPSLRAFRDAPQFVF